MKPPLRLGFRSRSFRLGMVALAFGLIAAACGGGVEGDVSAPPAETVAPGTLPDIALVPFDGGPDVTLNDFVGRPLVVNFWAEWCPSCVAEMSAAFRPAQERLGDRVTFIGINIQDVRARAEELLAETQVDWISLENQDGSLHTELGGLAMPFTVFISANGEVVDRHNGPLNEALLVERITEKLLG